ncbi:MAG: Fic family protein [Calditrichota bacterium]
MSDASFNPKFTITNRITESLTQIERARGFLDAAKLSEDWIRSMGARALLLEAHHTTHIEGTRLTLEQAEQLLAGRHVPDADPEDARELLNYRQAFDYVADSLDPAQPITEAVILEIHRRLVEGVRGGQASPGQYRDRQNWVVNSQTGDIIYTPPPPEEVPIHMAEFVRWLNDEREVHAVLKSGIAQFQLVHIHPFRDGNGRASRLLSTLCLYRAGYDFKRLFTISAYYDRDRRAFYDAIQGVRDRNMDMTGWLEYFVSGLSTQMREVTVKGERVIRRDVLVHEHGLNERQARIIGHILERGESNIQDFERLFPDLNKRTLQREIKVLLDRGLIITAGATNQLVYRIV